MPNDNGRKAQRGTALIEFTLVLPMLLIMTVAAVDFGRAFFAKACGCGR
jgi:Flp pilus assembly protein TadG